MWLKWFPWRYIVRRVARRQGFLDPLSIMAQFQNFAQPSDVLAPMELLKDGIVLQARGLMNSQAIQHNLDWVWPFWVVRQFDPTDDAFIPRAFSLTQINLTHRNWTAVGLPDFEEFPIVDPRGLLTPYYDGWSLDAWIMTEDRKHSLVPSRLKVASQTLSWTDNLAVTTSSQDGPLSLVSRIEMAEAGKAPVCRMKLTGLSKVSDVKSWLVVSLRPYNPEGVSFIHHIKLLDENLGWEVNKKSRVEFDVSAERYCFSYYRRGDVFRHLCLSTDLDRDTHCKVGMCTAAAMFELKPHESRDITVQIPFPTKRLPASYDFEESTASKWERSLDGACALKIPDEKFQFLYDAALRTVILHSPDEVYPGPYTYRRFWFRDAAFIVYAMLCAGLFKRAQKVLEHFPERQNPLGYFHSQEGEWDSNGEALWIIHMFSEMTRIPPSAKLMSAATKGAGWIIRKRLSADSLLPHAGLFPAGFSAEHLGPNDYYYWDNFWGIAGLEAAADLEEKYGDKKRAVSFGQQAEDYRRVVERSLKHVQDRLGSAAMPAAPYRRMDSGAVGSLAGGYPLQIFDAKDPRLTKTAEYLLDNCSFEHGFFHDMTHSGINPYLTLHIAQVLLRAGDPRYFDLMNSIAQLASPTGQWPEAVHPRTKGGCMGDGQHVWAAGEWILMMRNCFVREEGSHLILCSGIPRAWLEKKTEMTFGPAPTVFGPVNIRIKPEDGKVIVEWTAQWFDAEPEIYIRIPGFADTKVKPGSKSVALMWESQP